MDINLGVFKFQVCFHNQVFAIYIKHLGFADTARGKPQMLRRRSV